MLLLLAVWATLLVHLAGGSPNIRNPLCVRQDVACSKDNSCMMRYIPNNSSVCGALPFHNKVTSTALLTLGQLNLNTYLFVDKIYEQTAFNITFHNISWTHMQFRISLSGNIGRNTCREFIRATNSTVTDLSYSCLWSDERYEGKSFVLEYEARREELTETARLSFLVPFAVGINPNTPPNHWQILLYVESVPSQLGRTTFNLFWRPAPVFFGVENYKVYAFSNNSEDEATLIGVTTECDDQLCSFVATKWFGVVQFGVQPIYSNAEGVISKSPVFDLGGDSTRPILVGIVSCSVILPAILYLLLLLRNYLLRRHSRKTPPKVLLVYTPSTTPHLQMVETLAHYLNNHCNVIALMDEIDIPNFPDKDPFVWCNEAMLSADVVAVVASPHYKYLRSTAALYRTDRLLLRLLRERLSVGGKTRFCVLMPKYTTLADVPFEAINLRKYKLIEDLDMVLHLAHFQWLWPRCLLPAVTETPLLSELSRDLQDCISVAAADLHAKKHEYLNMIEEAKINSPRRFSDDEIKVIPKNTGILRSWNPFEGKTERILLAKESLSAYPGNIDTLNLLGNSELQPVSKTTEKSCDAIDLDQLSL